MYFDLVYLYIWLSIFYLDSQLSVSMPLNKVILCSWHLNTALNIIIIIKMQYCI